MTELLGTFKIKVPSQLYLKDPETSALGRAIVRDGLLLMEEIGFDAFTFKKLADKIGSPESSVYRYFENKQNLLTYLLSIYWSWQEYRIVISVSNVPDARQKLEKAIEIMNFSPAADDRLDDVALQPLFLLAEQESVRAFLHTRPAPAEREGALISYRRLLQRLVRLIQDIAPAYPHPAALASSLLDLIHLQPFYARDQRLLTDLPENGPVQSEFFTRLVLSSLNHG